MGDMYIIENGTKPDADKVMQNYYEVTVNRLRLDLEMSTLAPTVTFARDNQLINIIDDRTDFTWSGVNTGFNGWDGDQDMYMAHGIDCCNDSSVDTNIWTWSDTYANDPTESTSYLIHSYTANEQTETLSLIAEGANSVDFKTLSNDVHIRTRANIVKSGNLGAGTKNWTGKIQMSDGASSHIDLWSHTENDNATGYTSDDVWDIYVDKSAGLADVYKDGVLVTADIDISSLSKWYIRYYCTFTDSGTGNVTGSIYVYYLLYMEASGSTIYAVLDETTTGTLLEIGVATVDVTEEANAGTFSVDISSNNGSNWTSIANNTGGKVGTVSTTGKIRLKYVPPASITVDGDHFVSVQSLAAQFFERP